jgi:hypothetical protein
LAYRVSLLRVNANDAGMGPRLILALPKGRRLLARLRTTEARRAQRNPKKTENDDPTNYRFASRKWQHEVVYLLSSPWSLCLW